MGRVLVPARIENAVDVIAVAEGKLAAADVRAVCVPDALVDTGVTGLSMPKSMLATLGLNLLQTRTAITSGGEVSVRRYDTVRLTIMDRDCPTDVTELPDGCPVLIGQIPLEAMDLVVNMKDHRLTGNPAHGGEPIIELY